MSTTSSYQLIQKLLEFQNSFLNLVHSQILSFTQQQQRKQALLKFQILRMGDKNETFNEILLRLKRQLIEQKEEADPVLKNYFVKVLDLDFLPFMHINRYELTKLAIFGFDIYIDPLQAILQILNRLQRIFYIVEQSLKQQQQEFCSLINQKKSPWQILLTGWKPYYTFLHFYKLSLNIYMLKQYIQTAGTSLFKKDKEIVFTGVYNLNKKLIPRLRGLGMIQGLLQLAELNNTMYNFHGSFDYFMFYTYLTPERKYYRVYEKIVEVEKKCKHTNILTPLLFGVLNNYKAFLQFINLVDSKQYVHLLRVLLSGIIINFKLRILQYNQLLELIGLTINKLSLLKAMKLSIITDDLTKEWRQAKEFFISAFKSGYNVGEIQTWNLSEVESIQPKIIGFLVKGLLLQEKCRDDAFVKRLERTDLEEVLAGEIKQLTDGTQTLSSLTNNWKVLDLSQKDSKNQESTQSQHPNTPTPLRQQKCLNIIRITNLLNILQNYSQRIIFTIISLMKEITSQDSLIRQVLVETSQTLNMMITVINRKESISNLKTVMPQFHLVYPPKRAFEDIVPVYLHCFVTREAISNLIDVILKMETVHHSVYSKQLLTSLMHKYCHKPTENSHQVLKSFQKQYRFSSSITQIDPSINGVFSTLIKIITTSQQKRQLTSSILINLLRFSPTFVIGVMSLPVTVGQRIESFISWMINSDNEMCENLLIEMLGQIKKQGQKSQSLDLKDYLNECFYVSVMDNVLMALSNITEGQKWEQNDDNVGKVLRLIRLFVSIKNKFITVNQQAQNLKQIHETLQKVWTYLQEVLSFIMKNAQFNISTITTSCTLYWQISKALRNSFINEWYQKLLFNLIFSTFTSQNLLTYETFKRVSFISSSKNYMISRQSQKESQQKDEEAKKQRYGFGEIKQFVQSNYKGLCEQKGVGLSEKSQLEDFLNIVQISRKDIKTIRTSMHLSNEKDMPPCLGQENLQRIYQAYVQCCESKNTQQQAQREQIQFCLHLLRLNPANHKILWGLIKKSQRQWFLEEMNFTRETIREVLDVLNMLQERVQTQEQLFQSSEQCLQQRANLTQTQLLRMLGIELLSKNVNELEILASSYYFDSSKIQTFLQNQSFLWFLIVCNNSSWRQFNQVFSNYLKSKSFLSLLLQYKEFLFITKKASRDYQSKVQEMSQLVGKYTFYVQKKLDFIQLLKNTDSEKENQIRRSTLLINVKVLMLKCQFQKILQKVAVIATELHQNSLPDTQFKHLLASIRTLNKLCNSLLQGNIKLPTFMYHNLYMTSESDEKQFSLGRWVEEAERALSGGESGEKEKWSYVPERGQFRLKGSIEEFLVQKSEINVLLREGLNVEVESQACYQALIKLRENLKDLLSAQSSMIQIRHQAQSQSQTQSEADLTILNDLYKFGYLLYWEEQSHKENSLGQEKQQKFSSLLGSLIRREALPLEIIKEVDAQAYHQLKFFLMKQKATNLTSSLSIETQSPTIETQSPSIETQSPSIQTKCLCSTDQVAQGSQTEQSIEKQTQQAFTFFIWGQKQLIEGGHQVKVTEHNKNQYIDLVAQAILGKKYLSCNQFLALGYLNAKIIRENIKKQMN